MFTYAGVAYGPTAKLSAAADEWGQDADALGQRAEQWRNLPDNPTISAEGASKAYNREIALESQAGRARGIENAARDSPLLPDALQKGAGAKVLGVLNANPGSLVTGTSALARGSKAILGKVPYVGLGVTAFGVGADIENGKSPEDAVEDNVIPFAAGTAASAGTAALLLSAGLVGGPVGVLAVGAGLAVSLGVGWAWDKWGDDIKHGLGSIF